MLDAGAIKVHRSGSGSPLVLLHCLGVDHRFFDFLKPLEDRHTLIRYDLPGHGETPVPKAGYGIEHLSAQLADVFRRENIGRAHVAGISLGGLIAQHFAANHPELVDRLVLMDTTPRYTEDVRAMWAVRAATARKDGVIALVPGLLKIWFSDACLAENPPGVRYVRERLGTSPGEGYALACEALAAADLRPDVARIKAPTLVIGGDNDIPSFIDSANWLAANIEGARLEWLRSAKHAAVLEQGDRTVALLREFLR